MAKKLMVISYLLLDAIGIAGIFVKFPQPFLIATVPTLTIICIASFFKEEVNAEKRIFKNLEKRY